MIKGWGAESDGRKMQSERKMDGVAARESERRVGLMKQMQGEEEEEMGE